MTNKFAPYVSTKGEYNQYGYKPVVKSSHKQNISISEIVVFLVVVSAIGYFALTILL